MRDDLHKKAPIPRKAQTVLKLAGREADRCHPERLRDAAISALEQAAKRGFSPATLSALSQSNPQSELFAIGADGRQACSPTEGDLFHQFAGASAHGDGCEALERSLLNLSDAYAREVRATLVAEGNVRNVAEILRAFSNAFEGAAKAVSANLCRGVPIPHPSTVIQIDDDLLPTRKKRSNK